MKAGFQFARAALQTAASKWHVTVTYTTTRIELGGTIDLLMRHYIVYRLLYHYYRSTQGLVSRTLRALLPP